MLQYNLKELKLLNNCKFVIDGKASVETVTKKVIEAIETDTTSKELQPLKLLLLDNQMPYKYGPQVMHEVRLFYAD